MSDYKINSIILNQNSNISQNTNEVNVVLPTVFYSNSHEVALASLFIYFSWFNITSAYNNNRFSYIWTNGTTYQVVMPDGYYSPADITGYLQYVMTLNGHYLVDDNGQNVYFLGFVENSVYYKDTFTSTPVPSILPTGWTNPSGVILTGNRPQLIIPSNNKFGLLLGFNPQTMPISQVGSLWQQNSDITPQVSPVVNVNVVSNLANSSGFNQIPGIIASFSSGNTVFGGQIVVQPTFPVYFTVPDGRFENVSIRLYDQNNIPLGVNDATIICTLYLRSPRLIK